MVRTRNSSSQVPIKSSLSHSKKNVEDRRICMYDAYVHGKSASEVAREYGVTPKTVRRICQVIGKNGEWKRKIGSGRKRFHRKAVPDNVKLYWRNHHNSCLGRRVYLDKLLLTQDSSVASVDYVF